MGYQLYDFGQDIMNEFLIENKNTIDDYDQDMYIRSCKSVLYESVLVNTLSDKTVSFYKDYIMSSYSNLQTTSSGDFEKIRNFYNEVYQYVNSQVDIDISIPLYNIKEVEKIRPKYLMMYTSDLQKYIAKVLSSKKVDDKDFYSSKSTEYITKLKQQLVKTKLATMGDNVGLTAITRSPNIYKVSNEFITNDIIPFFDNFNQVIKELSIEVNSTITYIDKSYKELMLIDNSLEKVLSDSKLDITLVRKLNQIRYNASRTYLVLISHVTTMIMTKINSISFNLIEYYKLYNTFSNFYPEGEKIIKESALLDDLKNRSDSEILNSMLSNRFGIIDTYLKSTIEKKKNDLSNHFSISDDDDLSQYPYNEEIYMNVSDVLEDIEQRFDTFITLDSQNEIFDKCVEDSRIDEYLYDEISPMLNTISDVDYYFDMMGYGKEGAMFSAYKELEEFPNLMETITDMCKNIRNKLTSFKEQVNRQTLINKDELMEFINSFIDQYDMIVLQIGKKFIERISELENIICFSETDIYVPTESFSPINLYVDGSLNEINEYTMEEIELGLTLITEDCFKELIRDYTAIRHNLETGETLIFEAGNEKDIDKVSFKRFIQKLMDAFRNKVMELVNNNVGWIKKNKDKLLELDTTTTTIELVPYRMDTGTFVSDISSAQTKISTLNANQLYQKTQAQLRSEIFPFLPLDQLDKLTSSNKVKNPFAALVKQHYMTGKNEVKTTSISGEKVKTKIKQMIGYCEGYQTLFNRFNKALIAFGDSVDMKMQNIDRSEKRKNTNATSTVKSTVKTSATTTTTNESVLLTALFEEGEATPQETKPESKPQETKSQTTTTQSNVDDKKDDTKPSVEVKPKPGEEKKEGNKSSSTNIKSYTRIINSDARLFAQGILTALEQRYVDYINVLKSLISQNKA